MKAPAWTLIMLSWKATIYARASTRAETVAIPMALIRDALTVFFNPNAKGRTKSGAIRAQGTMATHATASHYAPAASVVMTAAAEAAVRATMVWRAMALKSATNLTVNASPGRS